MNNTTFIEKAFYGNTKKVSHGNLFKDSENNIYSYGYHYPLLFTASDNQHFAFVNTTGYSNSTSKHIGKAKMAVGNDRLICVELDGARLPLTIDAIHTMLGAKVVELKALMDSKKRKDTQVYRMLSMDYERVLTDYNKVKGQL